MECPVGFRGNAIFEFYKKQGLDLRADQKKVPNNNHENLVRFLSKCTLAGLLCSRMLNFAAGPRRPPLQPAAPPPTPTPRRDRGGIALGWSQPPHAARQPPALSLPRPLNNSMCTGHSRAFRAGFAHSGRTGNTAYQAWYLTVESQYERRAYADARSHGTGRGGHLFQ